jgi:hypothetical protein
MSRGSRAVARASLALAIFAAGAQAQSIIVQIANPQADSIPPAPNIAVFAVGAPPAGAPYRIRLRMARDAEFRQVFYDSSLTGESRTFTIDSLLTEHMVIHMRAQLIDRANTIVADTTLARPILGWLQLLDPPQQKLTNLSTTRPQFRWTSPPITFLWEYDLKVINTHTGDEAYFGKGLTSNSRTLETALEANTPYAWQVTARKQGGPGGTEVTVKSVGTFIISVGDRPTATIAYQNFPNPFGRGISPTTCFWFDLDTLSQVRLTIYSLNLHRVRNLIPGSSGTSSFVPGIYGRSNENEKGCDMLFSWDGRDDNGRFVPAGIYIAEFRANGQTTTKKIYFKGP